MDPTFDQLISALGHIASQKPKPLIDSMMLWRKNKSDAASEARAQLQQVSFLSEVLDIAHIYRLEETPNQVLCFDEIQNLHT